jgi:hypothetical protein
MSDVPPDCSEFDAGYWAGGGVVARATEPLVRLAAASPSPGAVIMEVLVVISVSIESGLVSESGRVSEF